MRNILSNIILTRIWLNDVIVFLAKIILFSLNFWKSKAIHIISIYFRRISLYINYHINFTDNAVHTYSYIVISGKPFVERFCKCNFFKKKEGQIMNSVNNEKYVRKINYFF